MYIKIDTNNFKEVVQQEVVYNLPQLLENKKMLEEQKVRLLEDIKRLDEEIKKLNTLLLEASKLNNIK
jgi:hypothetical protein